MKKIITILLLIATNLFSFSEKNTKFELVAHSGYITNIDKYSDRSIVYYLSCGSGERCFYNIRLPKGIYEYYNSKGTDSLTFVIVHGTVYKLGINGSAEYENLQIIQK